MLRPEAMLDEMREGVDLFVEENVAVNVDDASSREEVHECGVDENDCKCDDEGARREVARDPGEWREMYYEHQHDGRRVVEFERGGVEPRKSREGQYVQGKCRDM